MIDLRSKLAAYFQVDGGVLVTDVPNHTPAAAAGIKPGDVITRIDDVAVRSVQGLRLTLSRADATIPLTLVRQGATVTVLLREIAAATPTSGRRSDPAQMPCAWARCRKRARSRH